MKPVARVGRVRRSTIVYAVVFCLAVVLYFVLRPEPAVPATSTRISNTEPTSTTTRATTTTGVTRPLSGTTTP